MQKDALGRADRRIEEAVTTISRLPFIVRIEGSAKDRMKKTKECRMVPRAEVPGTDEV